MHSPLTHGVQHLLESSLNPPEKKIWSAPCTHRPVGQTASIAKKKQKKNTHSLQPEKITGESVKNTGTTNALINVSWLGEVHGMTNTLPDAAGVGNTAGQSTRAIAEVILIYFPILVFIASTTRKLKRQTEIEIKEQPRRGIWIIIWVVLSSSHN